MGEEREIPLPQLCPQIKTPHAGDAVDAEYASLNHNLNNGIAQRNERGATSLSQPDLPSKTTA